MDKETKDYLKRVVKGIQGRPVPVLQLGMAMIMDKPIVMIAFDDVPIPENIRKVAVAIERVKRGDTAGYERAVTKVMETVRKH